MKKKLLVFGHSGNLGSNLIYFLKDEYQFTLNTNLTKLYFPNVNYVKLDKRDFLNNNKLIKKKIKDISPDIILNCAACTDLDLCEKKPHKTSYVNVILPSKKN